MKRIKLVMVFLMMIVALFGCENSLETDIEQHLDMTVIDDIEIADMFSDRDKEVGYDESESISIEFIEDVVVFTSENIEVNNNDVTIKASGTYILKGTSDNGMIIIDVEDDEKVQLVLDNLYLTNDDSAVIYVKNADKVFMTMANDSENVLTSSQTFVQFDDNNIDAVIFSRQDITLNGQGTLEIISPSGNGIVSIDDLVITSGNYKIISSGHGLEANDSVRILSGDFEITVEKDGIHAENSENTDKGFIYIADGVFTINSLQDAISASSYLWISDGEFVLKTQGGSSVVANSNQPYYSSETDSAASSKGLKATQNVIIRNGTYIIDSVDDGIHANGNIRIDNANITISTNDDGLHADNNLMIDNANINILNSYEGLEGKSIDILAGIINILASDDGINAAGGNDSSGFNGFGNRPKEQESFVDDEEIYINIAGGDIYINASGDGIDSNGSLIISGGITYIDGPVSGGNGAIDYNGEAIISNGIIVAVGTSDMAQNFSTSSTQGSIMINTTTQQAGTLITLNDINDQELITWSTSKSFSSVVISCPDIIKNEVYVLTIGDSKSTITMDNLIYGTSNGMGRQPGNTNQNPGVRR